MLALPSLISTFGVIPVKMLTSYFMNLNKMIVKFVWKGNTMSKKNQVERLIPLKLKNTVKLLYSSQRCERTQTHQWKAHKWIHVKRVNCSLAKDPRQLNAERTVFSTSDAATTGHRSAKKIRYRLYTTKFNSNAF